MKTALVILNPQAGMRKAAQNLSDILITLQQGGYVCTVLTTTCSGDATQFVLDHGRDKDLIVCIGGDGTYNEVAAGVLKAGLTTPLGYIPAGSTNDFANSLHLSAQMKTAAQDVVNGQVVPLDMGSFGGRPFAYVAAFGAFSKTSYSTPQTLKNMLGHLAYLLEGIKDLANLQPIRMFIEADGQAFQDDYLFGAVSNSTQIGGMLHLNPENVDMSDGLLELLLIRTPKSALELAQVLLALNTGNYDGCDCIRFLSARRLTFRTEADVDWALDGEKATGSRVLEIVNLPGAIRFVMPRDK